jgi:WhiB family redox-sensing transcriptional regulator
MNPHAWRDFAICSSLDPELFYPFTSEKVDTDRAKAVCFQCPVIGPCGEYALARREPHGIWGGMTEEERRTELRRRQPARARARSALPAHVSIRAS